MRWSARSPKKNVATHTAPPSVEGSSLARPRSPEAPATIQLQRALGNRATAHWLQAKLRIGPAHDALEQEADRVADHVIDASGPVHADVGIASAPGSGVAQRKCASCEKEEESAEERPAVVQRKCAACEQEEHEPDEEIQRFADPHGLTQSHGGGDGGDGTTLRSPGSGQPLSDSVRTFFEPRFGQSFADVRVHTDSVAARAARSIDALAYTSGSSVVFGQDRYRPDTREGQHLLAHELTHVVQQRGGVTAQVQRATTDPVGGVDPDAASFPDRIFFDRNSFTIPASESPKVTALATPAGRALDLNGFSSEEGSLASRTSLTDARIAAVDNALRGAGHTGAQTAHPNPRAGEGNIHYRSMRAVEVLPVGGASSVPSCVPTAANPTPQIRACGTAFSRAFPIGVGWLVQAMVELGNATPTATAEVGRLFPGSTTTTLLGSVISLMTQYAGLAGHNVCHTTCDSQCDRPAYNSGVGAAQVMTLCPGFLDNTNDVENAETLVHETLHATPGIAALDNAYSTTREIDFLSAAGSSNNTDSYVLLVLRLQAGGAPAGTSSPPADVRGATLSPAEFATARRALSWLEQWLLAADWDVQQLYDAIQRNVGRAGGWDPADDSQAETQHVVSPSLGLTDPGPAPRATAPVHDDQINVAGIWDRFLRMRQAVYTIPITLNKTVGAAVESWAPGPGTAVTVDPAFFGEAPLAQVRRLLRLLASRISGISTARVAAYVDAADQIRLHFSSGTVGPP